MKVYVVTMYRWANVENHSYVLGVYSTLEKARIAGEEEKDYRGGNKYYPRCLECPIDEYSGVGIKNKVVIKLPEEGK